MFGNCQWGQRYGIWSGEGFANGWKVFPRNISNLKKLNDLNENQTNFSGDLYVSCKEFLILKGLFDKDDEYLDSYSGIDTRKNQDTKKMFDSNRKPKNTLNHATPRGHK